MPGIYGLIDADRATDLAGLLAAMAVRVKHHNWYVQNCHLDPAAGLALGRTSLGFLNHAEQPAWNEDRSLLALMEGEVYDYDDQRRHLTAAGHHFRSDSHAELLLHGYESEGKDYFRRLNGVLVAALWDTRAQRLILTNDRFGMKPLYYTQLPGRLLFASEIKALLTDAAVSRRLNPRGLAQFFTFGQLLGDDTLLEDVHLLPAAGWLTYDARADRLALDRYWKFEGGKTGAGRTEAETLDRLDEAFQRAVDRRVAGGQRLGISLSGGLDARTILAVIDHERVPITSVCLGIDGSLDHDCAERLAALTNRCHHRFVLNTRFLDRFEEHMHYMVHLTDGHYLCQCIVMPTLPLYRELGIEVLLRGHAGELMHMTKAYNFSLDRAALALHDEAGLEDWLFGRLRAYISDPTLALFAPPYADQIEQLARDSLRSCLRESAGMEPPAQRIAHLFLTQRIRRETVLSLVEFGSLVETRLPYLDNDLVELLLGTPVEWKLADRIQSHILRRRRPAFLDVVNANTGTRMGAGPLARRFAQLRLKVLGKLGVRGYQPYERLGLWLRRELRPFVQKILLSEQCLERGIFQASGVRTVVEDHWSNKRNHTFLLMALMIFELGQRTLLDEERTGGEVEPKKTLVP